MREYDVDAEDVRHLRVVARDEAGHKTRLRSGSRMREAVAQLARREFDEQRRAVEQMLLGALG